jgi:formylmethanofuran dehydrogenase subunit E
MPDEASDPDADSPPPLVRCEMCRCEVPEQHTTYMTGRRLCFACASAWFDGDEDA